MYFHDYFYSTIAQSALGLTDIPGGDLVIEELLRGNSDYWTSIVPHPVRKPKKLILNDWRARKWTTEKINKIITTLEILDYKGFELYAYQGEEFFRFTKSSLFMLHDSIPNSLMAPAHEDELIDLAVSQLHTARDELQIIGDYWLDVLISEAHETVKRSLKLSDFLALNQFERIKLIEVMQRSTQPLEQLIDDEFNIESDEIFELLCSSFPRAKIIPAYEFAYCTKSELMQLVLDGHLTKGPRSITKEQLTKLDSLKIIEDDLPTEVNPTESTYLIETVFPKIKKLDLGPFNKLFLAKSFTKDSLNNLNEIRIYKRTVTNANFNNLIEAAANLQTLNLVCCRIIDEDFKIPKNSLKNLNFLHVYSSRISITNLQQIVEATSNLIAVNIHTLAESEEDLHIQSGSWNSIIEFKLANSPIKKENLKQLLTNMPQLKKLSLCHVAVRGTTFGLDPINFKDLEELELSSNITNIPNINSFLIGSPKLKKLIIDRATCLIGDINIPPASLPQLTELCLTKTKLTAANIEKIIRAAAELRVLKLLVNNTDGRIKFDTINLSCLEQLELEGSSLFNTEDLNTIFKKALNLTIFSLTKCSILESSFHIEPGSLKNLEQLNCTDVQISKENYQKLIRAAPNLKILIVRNLIIQDNGYTYPVPVQNKIEEIDCSNSANLSGDGLDQFLLRFPKLKIIHLKDCPLVSFNDLNSLRRKFPHITFKSSFDDNIDENLVPSLITHNPDAHKAIKPTTDDFEFQFSGANKTKNQAMIVEKLSQYLALTEQNLHLIHKFQNGICRSLSQMFLDFNPEQWDQFINPIASWNGHMDSINEELRVQFRKLWISICDIEFKQNQQTTAPQYLGDNLAQFISQLEQPCRLINPWHDITIKPHSQEDNWLLYDPNSTSGPVCVTKSELPHAIQKVLGSLVSVRTPQYLTPIINNPQKFIKQGGLLALLKNENYQAMLTQIPTNPIFSANDLEGLLLKSTRGVPAWVLGLSENRTDLLGLTLNLLIQWHNNHPNYQYILKKSLAHTDEPIMIKCINNLTNIKSQNPLSQTQKPFFTHLIDLLQNSINPINYQKRLQTWRVEKSDAVTLPEYCKHCVTPGLVKNRLIDLNSTTQVEAMHLALEQQCIKTNRPYFYINSPKDLVCSAAYVERQKNRGIIRKGPGGPLYDFLQKNNKGTAPILIINYEQFKSDDIVRLNAILDKKRKADGTLVADDALVIGLRNLQQPNCYKGADFSSRFNKVEACSVPAAVLEHSIPKLPFIQDTKDDHPVINLFNSPNWQALLLGTWVLGPNGLQFKKGALETALNQGQTLEIKNGLWEDKNFVRFWQQAFVRGEILHAGRSITIPPNLKLIKSEGYDWETYKSYCKKTNDIGTGEVLNPHRFGDYLSRYTYNNNTKKLCQNKGIIEANKKSLPLHSYKRMADFLDETPSPLSVYLTRELSEDAWAQLLDECQQHNVQLQVTCAPGVNLPCELAPILAETTPTTTDFKPNLPVSDDVIISTDPDTTIAMLNQQNDWHVIDISECKSTDLLERLDGSLDQNSLQLNFKQKTGALLDALSNNKKIILKGHFSQELADRLAPLLLKRQNTQSNAQGTLVLVANTTDLFNYVPTKTHKVTKEDKWNCLGVMSPAITEKLKPHIDTDPLSTLKARCNYFATHPLDTSSKGLWQGMYHINTGINTLEPLNPKTSARDAKAFTKERLNAVNAILAHAPYVYLAGLSGVGKTTFVTKELRKNSRLYQGKKQLLQWAKDKKPGRKLLFIDEATLEFGQLSEFEGLFQNPPTILIDGTLYTLTAEHKVVFAGNPVSYGDERRLPDLLKRHGNSLIFNPLPTCVLYEELLKPIFNNTTLSSQAANLSSHFLNVYSFLVQCSTNDVLISPRELEMMVIMTLAHYNNHPEINFEETSRFFAYSIAKNLVPQEHMEQFNQLFMPKTSWKTRAINSTTNFLYTPSRLFARNQLDNLLHVRSLRQANFGSDSFQFGGLGGIILEGEPGTGKSDLVLGTLLDNGLREVYDLSETSNPQCSFIRMPVSMSLPEKTALLCKACDEGLIVVVDEINSSPMMEALLNNLLMGHIPGKGRPKHPGFMIIGTQNPATSEGRRTLSTALSRRLILEKIEPYTTAEMTSILLNKGLYQDQVESMIEAYEHNLAKAQKERLSPAPCFRDLLNLADEVIDLNNKRNPSEEPKPSNTNTVSFRPKGSIAKNNAGFFKNKSTEVLAKVVSEIEKTNMVQGKVSEFGQTKS